MKGSFGSWGFDRRVVDGAVNGFGLGHRVCVVDLDSPRSLCRRRGGQSRRAVVRRIELRVPPGPDRPDSELRAADAGRRLRFCEHLFAREVISYECRRLPASFDNPVPAARRRRACCCSSPRKKSNAIRWIANLLRWGGFLVSVPLWFGYPAAARRAISSSNGCRGFRPWRAVLPGGRRLQRTPRAAGHALRLNRHPFLVDGDHRTP